MSEILIQPIDSDPYSLTAEKTNEYQLKSEKRRENPKRYLVEDLRAQGLTVSRTVLYPGKSTRGHLHAHEELYYYISGHGKMTIGLDDFEVGPDMYIRVPGDLCHRVVNQTIDCNLIFLCLWNHNTNACLDNDEVIE